MIDYSKVIRKNPINPSAPEKSYASAQSRQNLSINDLIAHMADHGCPFSRGTIKAVLDDAIDCVKEQLLAGNSVSLGELGKFFVTLRSEGVCESMVDRKTGLKPVFTTDNITAVLVKWRPSEDMVNLRSKATFNCVGTRLEQAKEAKLKNTAIANGTYVPLGSKDKPAEEVE